MAGRDRRAGKQKDQHLLTFVCLLMCCGPPVLVVGGVMIYQWAIIRAGHAEKVDTFNDAVREWDEPSRTHAAFESASFTLALTDGSTPRLVAHLPAVLRMTRAPEARPIFAGVEKLVQFQPLRYELVLPGQTNATGIIIKRVFDESLRIGLSLYSIAVDETGVQHSTLVAEVPAFHVFRVAEVPTTALKCRHSYGEYNYAAGICTERQVAASVCVKVALAGVGSTAHWAPSSDGGNIGCDARDDWAPVRYEGVYTGINDARLVEHMMPVVVRNAGSPYILASDLTGGSLNFENSRTDKFALGLTLAIVGCAMSYPWILMCKRKSKRQQHGEARSNYHQSESESESESEQRDLLSGRLSSDEEEEDDGMQGAWDRDREGWRSRIRGRGRKSRQDMYLSRDSAAMLSGEDEDSSEDDERALRPAGPRPIGAPRIGAAASARVPAVYRPPPTDAKNTPSYRVVDADSAGQARVGSYAKHVRARRVSQAFAHPDLQAGADLTEAQRPLGGGHVRRAAPAAPAVTLSTTVEQADPDLEFASLASALGVDLASEEYLHDIIYEAILAPLPRPWASASGGSAGVYYINETSGATTPDHPLLPTLVRTIEARRRVFEEDEERRRQRSSAGVTTPAVPTNPAGRPNQKRFARSHSPTMKPGDDVTQTATAAAGHKTSVAKPHLEELQPASDADIFGEFFEAPETSETINMPRGGQPGDSGQPPVFAPLEVEVELDYYLNEPSPPALAKNQT